MFRQHSAQLYLDKWLQHLCHGDSWVAPHYLHCCTQSRCVQFLYRRCLQELAHFPHQSKLQLPLQKDRKICCALAQSSQDSSKGGSWHSVCTMGGGCALKSICIWTHTAILPDELIMRCWRNDRRSGKKAGTSVSTSLTTYRTQRMPEVPACFIAVF